ncbi:MAG: hypothetical protein ACJAS4_003221 [Bacteriovoracaceae bacterium]|jgi:hypothetical protein
MKFLILILIITQTAFAERIDFILDIDGVLVDRANKETVAYLYPPEKIQKLKLQNRVLQLNGHTYILNEGAGEFIDYLSKIKDSKITFFSTGPADRNKIFLETFRTSEGKRFIDIAEGRFFSYGDAIRVTDTGEAFTSANFEKGNLTKPLSKDYASKVKEFIGPVKKDITIIKGLNLERAILIDDRLPNATRGQEKNLLNVDLTLTRQEPDRVLRYIEGIPESRANIKGAIGKHYYSWSNRLMLTAGIIEQTIENAKKNKISIRDALWKIQWSESSKGLTPNLIPNKPASLFMRGEQVFSKINNSFKPINKGIFFCNYQQIFGYR